ncbi:hypothetical protein [Arthrobacter methylotrophus]|uniref:hypothetical protein n=1 Tax=Arthrobacter methylotrophus TaxID=121291 RepID=UPI0031E96A4D
MLLAGVHSNTVNRPLGQSGFGMDAGCLTAEIMAGPRSAVLIARRDANATRTISTGRGTIVDDCGKPLVPPNGRQPSDMGTNFPLRKRGRRGMAATNFQTPPNGRSDKTRELPGGAQKISRWTLSP